MYDDEFQRLHVRHIPPRHGTKEKGHKHSIASSWIRMHPFPTLIMTCTCPFGTTACTKSVQCNADVSSSRSSLDGIPVHDILLLINENSSSARPSLHATYRIRDTPKLYNTSCIQSDRNLRGFNFPKHTFLIHRAR